MKKFMKNISAFLTAAAICSSSFAFFCNITAFSEDSADLEYADNGECLTVTGCSRTASRAVIPAEMNGKPVTAIEESAFLGCPELKSVVLPDTIEVISNSAFSYCSSLESVTIPDSVTKIDEFAFYGCSSLTEVTIPDGVETIEWSAFAGCTALETVNIPDSVTYVGLNAFLDTPWLKARYRENPLLIVNGIVCSAKDHLLRVEIPRSATSIGDSAFESAEYLKTVKFPDTITSVGDYAFAYCKALKNVTLPDSVTSIGKGAFTLCDEISAFKIPGGVAAIEEETFAYSSGLKDIYLHKNVHKIGINAFENCESLEAVIIDDPDCEIADCSSTISNGYDEDFTFSGKIYGHKNSTAQKYAKKYNYDFGVIGDANNDGEFGTADLVALENCLLRSAELADWRTADKDNSGNIDVYDLILLRQQILEK